VTKHWHWRRWRWKPWQLDQFLHDRLYQNGFQVTLSKGCNRCSHVQFKMIKREET
jgi:hypothetical protein